MSDHRPQQRGHFIAFFQSTRDRQWIQFPPYQSSCPRALGAGSALQLLLLYMPNHNNFSQGALVKISVNSRNKEASCSLE